MVFNDDEITKVTADGIPYFHRSFGTAVKKSAIGTYTNHLLISDMAFRISVKEGVLSKITLSVNEMFIASIFPETVKSNVNIKTAKEATIKILRCLVIITSPHHKNNNTIPYTSSRPRAFPVYPGVAGGFSTFGIGKCLLFDFCN